MRSFNTAVPVVVDGTMYVPAGNRIVSLDADTGQEQWVHSLAPTGEQPRNASTRGVGYWPGDGSTPARILVMAGGVVFIGATNGRRFRAFDVVSGRQLWERPCARTRTR